jgi:adenine-specific DNA-methyltransferase
VKLRTEVTADKLRGGYYTPPDLVAFCWRRVRSLTTAPRLTVLEPAAGDGHFFRDLSEDLRQRIASVTAVEIEPAEAAKCKARLDRFGGESRVHAESFLSWSLRDESEFDVAVGNPPFVRFQFVSTADATATTLIGLRLHVKFEGVSNLWIPVLLAALGKLREGGAFSFVVPAELFTGLSAGVVRRWLLETATSVSIDLFPAGSFQGVLQEVVILSGQRVHEGDGARRVEIVSHRGGSSERWTHDAPASAGPWTRLLLSPKQTAAFDEASALPIVQAFGSIARMQVSIVTGANDYFCVDDETRDAFGLGKWSLPLLARVRHAPGLVWSRSDQDQLSSGTKRWLLHFAVDAPAPERYAAASKYLSQGVALGIPKRYKCRIREPWFRVPHVWAGTLLLSKRSHRIPRLLLNAARTYTTDTIYRGKVLPAYRGRERDLVASFHNSLTLLTSELEGRSFGGGVHELVPSEISRLQVPLLRGVGDELTKIDKRLRSASGEEADIALVSQTDDLIVSLDVGLTRSMLDVLGDARHALMWRRLERSTASGGDVAEEIDLLAV